ncbi:helix-turn-helix domain-containing protein [Paenibacillaceae bacterium WGS1546]|uniref:response regulator transcription factor n=1 Tax=Cohnella sp. WGS1546 TaxID=3366810 RepID=UPI00372D46B9
MHLLIVDDEIQAVRGIKSGIDWDKYGFGNVYVAHNIRQAKEVFEKHGVQLMLCDIEMPHGNGLELQRWVQENHVLTVSIFLTCHADFEYAKQAMRLGSLDYLLKPVFYPEMEEVIARAVQKIRNRRESLAIVTERFWTELLIGDILPNERAVKEAVRERNIPLDETMLFAPVWAGVKRWHLNRSESDRRQTYQLLHSCMNECLANVGHTYGVIRASAEGIGGVVGFRQAAKTEELLLRERCERLIQQCQDRLGLDICCYIGAPVPLHRLSEQFAKLKAADMDNVTVNNRIVSFDFLQHSKEKPLLPVLEGWAEMLKAGAKEKLLADMDRMMQQLRDQEGLSSKLLDTVVQDVLQIVYTAFQQKGIPVHQIFPIGEMTLHDETANRSLSSLEAWMKRTIVRVLDHFDESDRSTSIVERIKRYVAGNLMNDLSREHIAHHFFMNPDYMARIFKKETGMSFSDYMIAERIRVAKDLLANTNMAVSSVASAVGYANFSHFAKVFRTISGCNPQVYRRQFRS